MEKEINEMSKKLEDHEERIKKLENMIQSKDRKIIISTKSEIVDIFELFKSLDLSDYDYIYEFSGLSLYLTTLFIAKEELNIDGLSPSEISIVCKDKIRISKGVDRTTIGTALTNAGAYVDRIANPRGKGYAYRIMRKGTLFIQGQIEQ